MTPSREAPILRTITRVLVAEDDEDMRDLLVGWLREAGYEVTACGRGIDLLAHLEKSVLSEELPRFDLVVSDIRMPLGSALEVLGEFLGCDGVPPMILITGFRDRQARALARQLGALTVVQKPFKKSILIQEIRKLEPCGPRQA